MTLASSFSAHRAAAVVLVANTAPVAFGAIGTPILTAGTLTGIAPHLIGSYVGRQWHYSCRCCFLCSSMGSAAFARSGRPQLLLVPRLESVSLSPAITSPWSSPTSSPPLLVCSPWLSSCRSGGPPQRERQRRGSDWPSAHNRTTANTNSSTPAAPSLPVLQSGRVRFRLRSQHHPPPRSRLAGCSWRCFLTW